MSYLKPYCFGHKTTLRKLKNRDRNHNTVMVYTSLQVGKTKTHIVGCDTVREQVVTRHLKQAEKKRTINGMNTGNVTIYRKGLISRASFRPLLTVSNVEIQNASLMRSNLLMSPPLGGNFTCSMPMYYTGRPV